MDESKEIYFEGLVAQKSFIVRDNHALFVKSPNETRWDFPGGRLNMGEEAFAGLKREVMEEIGCDCEIQTVITTTQSFHGHAQKQCLFFNYLATIAKDAEIVIPKEELVDYHWIPFAEFKNIETFEHCRSVFNAYFHNA